MIPARGAHTLTVRVHKMQNKTIDVEQKNLYPGGRTESEFLAFLALQSRGRPVRMWDYSGKKDKIVNNN